MMALDEGNGNYSSGSDESLQFTVLCTQSNSNALQLENFRSLRSKSLTSKKVDIYQKVRLKAFQVKLFSVALKIYKPKEPLFLHTIIYNGLEFKYIYIIYIFFPRGRSMQ